MPGSQKDREAPIPPCHKVLQRWPASRGLQSPMHGIWQKWTAPSGRCRLLVRAGGSREAERSGRSSCAAENGQEQSQPLGSTLELQERLDQGGRAQALGEQVGQVPWNQMAQVSVTPFVLPARLVRNWADPRHS